MVEFGKIPERQIIRKSGTTKNTYSYRLKILVTNKEIKIKGQSNLHPVLLNSCFHFSNHSGTFTGSAASVLVSEFTYLRNYKGNGVILIEPFPFDGTNGACKLPENFSMAFMKCELNIRP